MKVAEPTSPPTTMARPRSKPLLPIRGVVSLVDRNEDQVLAMIEEGKLAWAWDLQLDPKSGRTRELRVLPAALASYLRGETSSLEWADVLNLLAPNTPTLRACDLSHVLNVSTTHISNLIRQKALASRSEPKPGPLGSARIPMDAFSRFLKDRRFP